MPQASYVKETLVVRQVCTDPNCRWRHTKHALDRMVERDVSQADIEYVLTYGQVTLIETNKPDILWRVEGPDVDGRHLRVEAAVFKEEILVKVITVF